MKNLIFIALLCMCAWWIDGCAVAKLWKTIPGSIGKSASLDARMETQGIHFRPNFKIHFKTPSGRDIYGGHLGVTYSPATVQPRYKSIDLTTSSFVGHAPPGATSLFIVLDYAGQSYEWTVLLDPHEYLEITLEVGVR
ncbi:MAG: hypothetical protein WCV85_04545 [Patescibacteria group bacterium]|jgi:hypothetical protein